MLCLTDFRFNIIMNKKQRKVTDERPTSCKSDGTRRAEDGYLQR